MKTASKYLLILLLGGGTMVFAGGGLEEPPGEPPHGTAVQSNAPGTKLTGEIMIEFYDIDTTTGAADVRLLLRLRKGSDFAMFYGETSVEDLTSPSEVQTEVMEIMVPRVIDRFFGNNDGNFTNDGVYDVRVKSLQEFGELTTATSDPSSLSTFVLSNIEIAVR